MKICSYSRSEGAMGSATMHSLTLNSPLSTRSWRAGLTADTHCRQCRVRGVCSSSPYDQCLPLTISPTGESSPGGYAMHRLLWRRGAPHWCISIWIWECCPIVHQLFRYRNFRTRCSAWWGDWGHRWGPAWREGGEAHTGSAWTGEELWPWCS